MKVALFLFCFMSIGTHSYTAQRLEPKPETLPITSLHAPLGILTTAGDLLTTAGNPLGLLNSPLLLEEGDADRHPDERPSLKMSEVSETKRKR